MRLCDWDVPVCVLQIQGQHPIVALKQMPQVPEPFVAAGHVDAQLVDLPKVDHQTKFVALFDDEGWGYEVRARGLFVSTRSDGTVELLVKPRSPALRNGDGARLERPRLACELEMHPMLERA